MYKYIIVLKNQSDSLTAKLAISGHIAKDEVIEVSPTVWAVQSPLQSKELSEVLFPRDQETPASSIPSHVVFRIDAYWGFHEKALWEWLSAR